MRTFARTFLLNHKLSLGLLAALCLTACGGSPTAPGQPASGSSDGSTPGAGSGSTGGGAPVGGTASGGGSSRLFAPYMDMALASGEQVETIQQQAGLKGLDLAFIVATGNGCSLG